MKITLATKLTKFKHHVYDKRRKFPKIFLTFPLIAESTKQKNEKNLLFTANPNILTYVYKQLKADKRIPRYNELYFSQ